MTEFGSLKREDILSKFQIEPRKVYFREIFETREKMDNLNMKQIIDKSLVLFFAGPKSFTGEGSNHLKRDIWIVYLT